MGTQSRADLVAAWVVGIGVGLITLQITWLIANRLASLIWGVPRGPTTAFTIVVIAGVVTSIVTGRRLAKSSARRDIAMTTVPQPTIQRCSGDVALAIWWPRGGRLAPPIGRTTLVLAGHFRYGSPVTMQGDPRRNTRECVVGTHAASACGNVRNNREAISWMTDSGTR